MKQVGKFANRINEVKNILKNVSLKINESNVIFECIYELKRVNIELTKLVSRHKNAVNDVKDKRVRPIDCQDIKTLYPSSRSWSYTIFPTDSDGMEVFCDMDTDGGGWTVFQSRKDGSVEFNRTWNEYKTGFGNVTGEFWLGNDNIHTLVSAHPYVLRVDLQDFDGVWKFATYSQFAVANEERQYKLTIDGYSGDAGNSFDDMDGMLFSTIDVDNDNAPGGNCPFFHGGGWWYNGCFRANPNGLYDAEQNPRKCGMGINWYHWRRYCYSMKSLSVKVKREKRNEIQED